MKNMLATLLSRLKSLIQYAPYKTIGSTAFVLWFAYFWRNYRIFTHLPAHDDSIEVIWGILWYNHVLTEWVNPFTYDLIFYPEGWPVGILAHTPLLFLLSQPLHLFGGEVFAYNILAIIPFFISYIGAIRFFRNYSKSPWVVITVALIYTFAIMRSRRVWGHLNLLWATSLFPWLGVELLAWRQQTSEKSTPRHAWRCGVIWGGMIAFSLYSIFMAPVVFLLLDKQLRKWRTWWLLLLVGGVALLIGATAIAPYYFAVNRFPIQQSGVSEMIHWSSSLNGVFIPYDMSWTRQLSRWIYPHGSGEPRYHNLGLVMLPVLLYGFFTAWRKQAPEQRYGHVWLALAGLILALGPLLKYDAHVVQFPWLDSFSQSLWSFANQINPRAFQRADIPQSYIGSLPLPSYFVAMLIPYWSGARVTTRFVLFAFLGILAVVATSLDRLPKQVRWLLMGLMLLELSPLPTISTPLNINEVHPAHAWMMEQSSVSNDPRATIDIYGDWLHRHSPDALYLSWQTQIPSASSVGSFRPLHAVFLRSETGAISRQPLSKLARLFSAYQIKYVVVHPERSEGARIVWQHLQNDPQWFNLIRCFEPDQDYLSGWSEPICIAEVVSHQTIRNIHPIDGFSPEEDWGIWATTQQPSFNFVATAEKDHRLSFEVFPHCLPDRTQQATFIMHETILYEYVWSDCETIHADIVIPRESIQIGFNEVSLQLGYSISPAEIGTNGDPRTLSLGFNSINIQPVE